MEIITKFSLGDKLWTVRDCQAVCFEVGCIIYDGAVYYGETRYDATLETQCFDSKESLIKHIADGN